MKIIFILTINSIQTWDVNHMFTDFIHNVYYIHEKKKKKKFIALKECVVLEVRHINSV